MPAAIAPASLDPAFYAAARANMVESQLRPNRVTDEKLLRAFGSIAREDFLPASFKSFAYIDEDVGMGSGRKMLAPLTLARLLQELNVGPADRVLDIGAGTGYAAALLNDIAGETIALETDQALLGQMKNAKRALGLEQVSCVNGTLCEGFPAASPYQAVLIEGAVQWVPDKIVNQMEEGARLACVFYPEDYRAGMLGTARLYHKTHGVLSERILFDAAAPLLPGFAVRQGFRF